MYACDRKLIGTRSLNYLAAHTKFCVAHVNFNLFQNFEKMSQEFSKEYVWNVHFNVGRRHQIEQTASRTVIRVHDDVYLVRIGERK